VRRTDGADGDGVAVLGDMPMAGKLFRSKSETSERQAQRKSKVELPAIAGTAGNPISTWGDGVSGVVTDAEDVGVGVADQAGHFKIADQFGTVDTGLMFEGANNYRGATVINGGTLTLTGEKPKEVALATTDLYGNGRID